MWIDKDTPCMLGFVAPLLISIAVNILLPNVCINDSNYLLNRTDEFGVKKNVLSILYYVRVWLCQGGFAQEKTW